jgi:hypothetical protein
MSERTVVVAAQSNDEEKTVDKSSKSNKESILKTPGVENSVFSVRGVFNLKKSHSETDEIPDNEKNENNINESNMSTNKNSSTKGDAFVNLHYPVSSLTLNTGDSPSGATGELNYYTA